MDKINAELDLPSIEEGAKTMTEMVDAESGVGLDVACETFVSSLVAKSKSIVGI